MLIRFCCALLTMPGDGEKMLTIPRSLPAGYC